MTAESGGRDWTGADLAVVVGDYVAQLEKVLAGKPVDRAAHDRTVRFVTGKADGPISWKQGEIDLGGAVADRRADPQGPAPALGL